MKKLLVIAAAILSFSAVNAQVAYLGFQSITSTGKTTVGNTTTTTKNSNPGFCYFGRTEKDALLGDTKYSSWGIKIPVDVNYGFELADGFNLSVYAGPSIYVGLSKNGKNGNTTYDYYGDDISRFGLGLGMGAWCDIQDVIRVKLGYDLGLLNRAQNKDNFNYKESGFSISVGYLF